MSGSIYDRLKQKVDVQKYEEGITALDLASLPATLRKIMRTMLREVEMTHTSTRRSTKIRLLKTGPMPTSTRRSTNSSNRTGSSAAGKESEPITL
jgi:hypothetical protein